MIPPRLLQTWKSKTDIPPHFSRWSASFRLQNPQFEFELWDDHDNRQFIHKQFPWFAGIYNAYPAEIYRVDAMRYFYLYLYGGIYADMDTECLKPLDDLTACNGVVLARMGQDNDFAHSIPNAIMASSPRCEFWLFVISLMIQLSKQKLRPEYCTGPVLLKMAVDRYLNQANQPDQAIRLNIQSISQRLTRQQMPLPGVNEIHILPPDVWYPVDWQNKAHTALIQAARNPDWLHLAGTTDLLHLAATPGMTGLPDFPGQTAAARFPGASMVTWWTHTWEQGHGFIAT